MDAKLAQFQEEIRQGQEEAASRALKRASYDKPYVFRKRGNEEQASFNAKVDDSWACPDLENGRSGGKPIPGFVLLQGYSCSPIRLQYLKRIIITHLGWTTCENRVVGLL